jgi:hypothetical protein
MDLAHKPSLDFNLSNPRLPSVAIHTLSILSMAVLFGANIGGTSNLASYP